MTRPFHFSSGEFVLSREDLAGYCETDDHSGPKEMWVSPKHHGRDELLYLMHEMTHADHPDMSEDDVIATAENKTTLLWALGYRKNKYKRGKTRT